MYSETIITSLGLLSLSCSAQASQSPRLYTLGGYNNVYSSQYDSTFGMSLKGVYSFCNDEVCGVELPDLKGAQLGLHTNIQGASVYHELSLNVGLLYGSKSQDRSYGTGVKVEQRIIPVTLGYTLNLSLTETTTFFLGGKAGMLHYEQKVHHPEGLSYGESGGTLGAQIGLKFAFTEKANFVLGYELNRYFSNVEAYHTVVVGFSWNF